jgi:hypothetical protein
MRKDLDIKLVEKYPKLFAQRNKSMRETAMCWGFECGSGWYNIINMLCANIQGHIDNKNSQRQFSIGYNQIVEAVQRGDTELFNARYKSYKQEYKEKILADIQSGRINLMQDVEEEFPQVEVTQVKEKFGTLRFYTSLGDDYIYGAIAMAESMSAVTCETCGKPGKLFTYGWWHVACDEHKTQDDIEWEKEAEDEHLENDAS